MQVAVKSFAKQHKKETESAPSFILEEKLENESEIKPAVFYFEKGIIGTEYLYAGNHFCWRAPNETSFSAINVDLDLFKS